MKTHRALACLTGLAFLASLAACGGSDETGGPDPSNGPGDGKETLDPTLGGKADQDTPPVVEAGRFLEDGVRTGTFDGTSMPAFRIASFGDTKVRVSLEGASDTFDPVLVVDGPFPGSNPEIVAYNDDAGADTMNSSLEVTLTEKGAYRLVVGSYAAFQGLAPESGEYRLTFTCLENCTMPQMSLTSFVEQLRAEHGDELIDKILLERTPGLFEDPEVAAAVKAQAESFLAGAGTTDAFPVIPLAALPAAQGFMEMAVEADATEPPSAVTFDLDELLHEACSPDRGAAETLVPEIPELQRGYASDYRFDDCALLHTQQLAEVLNNLSLDNGSAVVAGGERYETVESAIRALVEAGHTIEARNNRYYANFLGLVYEGTTVAAPLWIDTGIPLPEGGTMVVPASHAHYHFVIEGPLLNGELMFYMGIPGGTAFRAHHTHRPSWSGERTILSRNSDQDLETVVQLFVTAGKLRKKWLAEGAGLPAQGYGKLGVCLDSTAVLEVATENTVSLFPLLHPAVDSPADEIDSLLAALPSDVAGTGNDTALDRLLASQPFDPSKGVDLEAMPFPTLKAELEALGVAP